MMNITIDVFYNGKKCSNIEEATSDAVVHELVSIAKENLLLFENEIRKERAIARIDIKHRPSNPPERLLSFKKISDELAARIHQSFE